MKRFSLILLAALMVFCLTSAMAAEVPLTTGEIPSVPSAPGAPDITRAQSSGSGVSLTFGSGLPGESLLEFIALDASGRETSVRYSQEGNTYTAQALPSGGQWLRVNLAWVSGGTNATARYSMSGSLMQLTRFDGQYNEFVYNADGSFYEFRSASSGVWTRFDASGSATCYSYKSQGMRVWFDFAGKVCWATYDDGSYSCTWEPGTGWFIDAPAGTLFVRLDLDPTTVKPLVVLDEPAPTPKVIWYPNNTITLAGLRLQEADPSLPDKWYNIVPVDLTREGRQTFFLVISDTHFVGECHVDVWDGYVTVTCDVLKRSGIEHKSEYGRWFTSLQEITASSIESEADVIPFGVPVSIQEELGGADVALLFIRSKATYRQPFSDGTELTRYWRNKPDWKTFRNDLTYLMQYVPR